MNNVKEACQGEHSSSTSEKEVRGTLGFVDEHNCASRAIPVLGNCRAPLDNERSDGYASQRILLAGEWQGGRPGRPQCRGRNSIGRPRKQRRSRLRNDRFDSGALRVERVIAKCHDVEVTLEQRAPRARHTGRGGRNRVWLMRSQGMVVVVMGSASGTAAAAAWGGIRKMAQPQPQPGGRKEVRRGAMEDNGAGAPRAWEGESKAMVAMAIKARGGWGGEEPVVREGHGKGRKATTPDATLICSRSPEYGQRWK